MDKINKIVGSVPNQLDKLASGSLEESNKISTTVNSELRMKFIEYKVIMSYFNLADMLSAIGGISKTLGAVTGSIGFLFIVQFVAQLSGVIRRKEKEQLRMFKIKKMMLYVPYIINKINVLAEVKRTPSDRQKLSEARKQAESLSDMSCETYKNQKEKMKILQELLVEFGEINRVELDEHDQLKYDLYERRMTQNTGAKIASEIRRRFSFVGMYMFQQRVEKQKLLIKELLVKTELETQKKIKCHEDLSSY